MNKQLFGNLCTKSQEHWTTQMKTVEQYFHLVLFIMLYKMVFTLKSVDKSLVCDHLNESY